MGFEVILHYREKNEDGDFDEEVKTKKIKVGSPYDDVELDFCAGKIIAQLANRKRLIEDVEIFEFTRKKLSYKESEDGIVIKNKKFKFDDGPAVQGVDTQEQQLAQLLATNPNLLQQLQQLQAQQLNGGSIPQMQPVVSQPVQTQQAQATPFQPANNVAPPSATVPQRPIREEIFNPPHPDVAQIEANNFQVGQKYPIYNVIERGMGSFKRTYYLVGDKNGKPIKKPAEFFDPIPQKLKHQNELDKSVGDFSNGMSNDIDLDYGNQWQGPVQDITTRG